MLEAQDVRLDPRTLTPMGPFLLTPDLTPGQGPRVHGSWWGRRPGRRVWGDGRVGTQRTGHPAVTQRSPSPPGARAGGCPAGWGQQRGGLGREWGGGTGVCPTPGPRGSLPESRARTYCWANRFPEAVAVRQRPESPVPWSWGMGWALHAARPVCGPRGQSLGLWTSAERLPHRARGLQVGAAGADQAET